MIQWLCGAGVILGINTVHCSTGLNTCCSKSVAGIDLQQLHCCLCALRGTYQYIPHKQYIARSRMYTFGRFALSLPFPGPNAP